MFTWGQVHVFCMNIVCNSLDNLIGGQKVYNGMGGETLNTPAVPL